ncbi:hypothetical protein PybrP1_000947, partial [[Pythium] brassicae (nom. inval.)]
PLNDIARPQSARPLVLLIDGLEHLAAGKSAHETTPSMRPSFGRSSGSNFGPGFGSDSNDCLVSALPSLASRLPNWVRVVVLSRKDPAIIAKLQGYTPSIVLDAFRAENEQDIRAYIGNTLGCPGDSNDVLSVAAGAASRNRSPSLGSAPSSSATSASVGGASGEDVRASNALLPEQVDLIVKRSEGLFLYAVNIVQSIEERRLADLVTAGMFFVDVANGHERIGMWAAREYETVVHANRNDFVNLDFGLEASDDPQQQHKSPNEVLQTRTRVYIVRHMCNHLSIAAAAAQQQAHGEECLKLMGKFLADDKFQLARHAALERFHEADPAHRSFEHLEVWQLLRREMPHYEDLITTSTSFYMIHQRRRVSARGREDERVPALPATKRRRQSTDGNETEAAATAVASRDDDADGSGDCRDRSDDCGGAQDERSAQETPSHAQPPPPSPSQSSRFLSTVPAAEELTTDAAYRRAKLEAVATRNALLAEQNAIAAERNLIALFAHRDDAMSQEFFDLKRSLEIAKLRRPVADT